MAYTPKIILVVILRYCMYNYRNKSDLPQKFLLFMKARVYNKEGGRVSYSSIVPCTAVVRVQARFMIFTMCGVIYMASLWESIYA